MLNKTIVQLIDDQINYEFFSAHIYLGIHAFYAARNLDGFANWFLIQAQEERDHAMLLVRYLLNNSEEPVFQDVKKPEGHFDKPDDPLRLTIAHERAVTSRIYNIFGAALDIKDFRTTQFLDWFIKEQGEEEKNAEDLLRKFELFAGDSKGLYLLDQELAARVYAPPTLTL